MDDIFWMLFGIAVLLFGDSKFMQGRPLADGLLVVGFASIGITILFRLARS